MFPAAAGTRSTLHAQSERWGWDRRARQMAVMAKAVDSLPDDSHCTRFRIEAAAGMRPSVDVRRLQLFTFLNRGSQGPSHGEKTGGAKTSKVERRRAAGPMRAPSIGCEPTAKEVTCRRSIETGGMGPASPVTRGTSHGRMVPAAARQGRCVPANNAPGRGRREGGKQTERRGGLGSHLGDGRGSSDLEADTSDGVLAMARYRVGVGVSGQYSHITARGHKSGLCPRASTTPVDAERSLRSNRSAFAVQAMFFSRPGEGGRWKEKEQRNHCRARCSLLTAWPTHLHSGAQADRLCDLVDDGRSCPRSWVP